jgi:hypothetical protein
MTVKRYSIYCERRPGDMLQENEHGGLVHWLDYDSLAAELAECRADAERWRFCTLHPMWSGRPKHELDAEVDAARAAESAETPT